jgi:hypothetical protein
MIDRGAPEPGLVPAGGLTSQNKRFRSGPVSRVLSSPIQLAGRGTAISLGRRLPGVSSSLPERRNRAGPARAQFARRVDAAVKLHGRSAWPCSGRGLPSQPGRPGCWCALTAPFHPYHGGNKTGAHATRGGLLSVALSRALRPVGVTDHPVLWSPDFPLLALHAPKDITPAAAVRPAPKPSERYRNICLWYRRSIIALGSPSAGTKPGPGAAGQVFHIESYGKSSHAPC